MVKANGPAAPISMDNVTFRRLRRVLVDVAHRSNTRGLPRRKYEDIQKVIVWMDNIANEASVRKKAAD